MRVGQQAVPVPRDVPLSEIRIGYRFCDLHHFSDADSMLTE